MNENERRRVIGAALVRANFDHMLAQSADFDETPARRMRPLDQRRADEGDDGANGEDDCDTRQHDTAKPLLDPPSEKG